MATKYTKGDWSAICDVCGFSFNASQLKERWDGFMVCEKDWEKRHPQDFIRPPRTEKALPWVRPEAPDQFIDVTYVTGLSCTPLGMLGQADYGSADCATVNNVNGDFLPA